ncbi:MAG: cytoplasmic protein [Ignavibacteriae bacterium]|nr:cytoplasmic protein [Ignavibacteriota bacterium]
MEKRPELNKKINLKDFQDFYWLKSELTAFCKEIGITNFGGKIEITHRIAEYLRTGRIVKDSGSEKVRLHKPTKPKNPISRDTIIGIEYRTYKEKKEFLQSNIGKQFHFTVHLLDWFKKNTGKKTYKDFIDEWNKEQRKKKDPNYKSEIAPQFEYNTYIRDFLKDNPDRTKKDAITCWKVKKSMRGNNIYNKSDLNILVEE